MADMSNAIDLSTYIPPTDVFRPRPEGEEPADVSAYSDEEISRISSLTDEEKIALIGEQYWSQYEQAYADFPESIPESLSVTVLVGGGGRSTSRLDRSRSGEIVRSSSRLASIGRPRGIQSHPEHISHRHN